MGTELEVGAGTGATGAVGDGCFGVGVVGAGCGAGSGLSARHDLE